MEGLNMPWFEDEQQGGNEKVGNVDETESYPLTLEEYCALPYLINISKDLQQFGALVIELNLVVHATNQDELLKQVHDEIKEWIQSRMDNKEPIPLPAGYEVHNGKVRRTPGTMGVAIPAQYQGYGRS